MIVIPVVANAVYEIDGILGRLPEGRYEDDIQEEYPSYVYAEVYKVTITVEKV